MKVECLDEDLLARFCDGLVDPSEAEAVRLHSRTCEDCHRLLVECLAVRATGTLRMDHRASAAALGAVTAPLPNAPLRPGQETARLPGAKSEAPPPVQAELVAGTYRLDRILGVGGMGAVYEATRVSDGARFALKTLHGAKAGDPQVQGRLRREARILGSMKSKHAVRVYDCGALPTGEPYIVMELLEGSDLHSVVTAGKPLAPEVVMQVMLDACDALGEAHRLGIVHRDVKPHNLFFAREAGGGVVLKLLDFGLGTPPPTAAEPSIAATRMDTMLGTPHYMAPEQMQDPTLVDPRADIYSLGATAYTLLAGTPPHAGTSLASVIASVMSRPAPPLAQRAPGVPRRLARVIDRCLAKKPAERYASCIDLAGALREAQAKPRRGLFVGLAVLLVLAVALVLALR